MRAVRRRRMLALLGIATVAIAALLAVVAIAPGGETPPATGAAALVPADALAYLNVSIDPGRAAVKRGAALGARFPGYARVLNAIDDRIGAIVSGGTPVQFGSEIRPWLGNEAALAILDTSGTAAGSLVVLDVSDRTRAHAFLTHFGAKAAGSYRGIQLLAYPTGTELAFVGHYLIFGQDASVRAGIDADTGAAPSLRSDQAYEQAVAGEPVGRVLDAYASGTGVHRLLAPVSGIIGAVGTLLDQPALGGVAISLTPASDGAQVRVHSVLDPELASPDHTVAPGFVPSLQSVLPAGSALLLDTNQLAKLAPRVLRMAAAAGAIGRAAPMLQRLGGALAAEGVNVPALLSIFSHETAVAISPPADALHAPALTILTRTARPLQVNEQLAGLEGPLAQLLPSPGTGPGETPLFNDVPVAGITAHHLSLGSGLGLDYAVFDGLVVLSTSTDGIADVVRRTHSLASEPAFRATVGADQQPVGSLVFLDFSQLLRLAEQTGLFSSARFGTLSPDLQRISAVGLSSASRENDTTAELFLQIP